MASPYSTGRRGVQYGATGAFQRAGSIKGADDFLKLSKKLKEAGDKGLRNEFHAAMRQAAKPLIPKVRAAALRDLPKQGGLNERVAKKKYTAQTRTGAKTAGVRITGSKVDPRINEGRVWHPVFGRKGKPKKEGGKNSVIQNIPSADGYFDDTIRDSAKEIREDMRAVLAAWTERLARG